MFEMERKKTIHPNVPSDTKMYISTILIINEKNVSDRVVVILSQYTKLLQLRQIVDQSRIKVRVLLLLLCFVLLLSSPSSRIAYR